MIKHPARKNYHHGPNRVKAGDRCELQPVGTGCFYKSILFNGVSMTFQDAMAHGYLTFEHPIPFGAERSYAVFTEKVETLNRPAALASRPTAPPSRAARLMTGPAYGLQREST